MRVDESSDSHSRLAWTGTRMHSHRLSCALYDFERVQIFVRVDESLLDSRSRLARVDDSR